MVAGCAQDADRQGASQADSAASIPATRSKREERYADVVVRSFRTALKPPAACNRAGMRPPAGPALRRLNTT